MPLVAQKHLNAGVEGEDLRIVIDEIALTAATRNIVANAISHTPAGEHVDLTVVRADGAVGFAIEDNGPGVAPADRERLFEPFFRTLGTGVPGSGLGLSIVKSLAIRMDAQVAVDPAQRYQSGLRVTLRLPG